MECFQPIGTHLKHEINEILLVLEKDRGPHGALHGPYLEEIHVKAHLFTLSRGGMFTGNKRL